MQHAVHEAGQSQECFQRPLVSSPDELGKRSSQTHKAESLPCYKEDLCSEAKKSEVLQGHFHPERGVQRSVRPVNLLGETLAHLTLTFFSPSALFLSISHILLGRSLSQSLLLPPGPDC